MNSAFLLNLLLSMQLSNIRNFLNAPTREEYSTQCVLENALPCDKISKYPQVQLVSTGRKPLHITEFIRQNVVMWCNVSRKSQEPASISTWTNWPKHVTATQNILRVIINSPFSHCWLLKTPHHPSSRARRVFIRVLTAAWSLSDRPVVCRCCLLRLPT